MKNILIVNNEKYEHDFGWIPELKSALSEIEKLNFTVIHHSKFNQNAIRNYKPDYIICSGRANEHWTMDEILRDYKNELEFLIMPAIPTLAICAGLQLAAIAHNVNVNKMIESSDIDILEQGYVEIEIIQQDPIFSGLEHSIICFEFHRDESKGVPVGFDLLASNSTCQIQMIKKINAPLYCTQFHPEKFNKEFPDGKLILQNFLNLPGPQ